MFEIVLVCNRMEALCWKNISILSLETSVLTVIWCESSGGLVLKNSYCAMGCRPNLENILMCNRLGPLFLKHLGAQSSGGTVWDKSQCAVV